VRQAFLVVPAMVAQEWKGRNVCRTADWRLSERERLASPHILSFRRFCVEKFCVASLPPEDCGNEPTMEPPQLYPMITGALWFDLFGVVFPLIQQPDMPNKLQ
jgi:hypothetical protein